ncbi:alanine racemase [Cohnella caldifontis]|uniref:alanine racemase n=1 Tax=Cohnella caldifontis TaxID=3027471 RepID=UPI0023EBF7EC|nr:alanine racemase [Cohnella sp. YIM B05605]
MRGQAGDLHRVWAEINLDHLAHNLRLTRSLLPDSTNIMAVVKANAYGHGDRVIASRLAEWGVGHFAVSTVEEAVSLRRCGIRQPILILGASPPGAFPLLAEHGITQTVHSSPYAERLNDFAVRQRCVIPVHLKIDTGMNRIGFPHDDIRSVQAVFRMKGLQVGGTFTHLAAADLLAPKHVRYTRMQTARFEATLRRLKGWPVGMVHALSSAGIVNGVDAAYDAVRPGLMLFGLYSGEASRQLDLKPVMQLKARIAMVKKVRRGEAIGYGQRFVAPREMVVATIQAGYGDGYPRSLSGRAEILIRGQPARQIGLICMDQMMADVTEIDDVREGDAALLFGEDRGRSLPLSRLSAWAGTIDNELVAGVAARVPRVYAEHAIMGPTKSVYESEEACLQRS